MTDLTFRQLKVRPPTWKGALASRPYSPFDSTHSATLQLLRKELKHLGARSAFLQVELSDPVRGVRNDGQIRANATVVHPGVILTVETANHGTLVYPCDAFQGRNGIPGWQANLRAIALGLEALRKVERYGIAERSQQYAGFAELGSGTPMGAGEERPMSLDEAAVLLTTSAGHDADQAREIINDPVMVADLYRFAVKAHHPDVGGDPDVFRRLTEARDLLIGAVS